MSVRLYIILSGVVLIQQFGLARPICAQDFDGITVRGHVFESADEAPLMGVNVFLAGSTFGSSTDREGAFSFSVPSGRKSYEITASMIGFEIQSVVRSSQDLESSELSFYLSEKMYRLDEVTVSASNTEWLDNLRRFERLVFSTSENAKQCKIESPELLSIAFNASTGELTASSNEPFNFRNEALGYAVSLHGPKIYGSKTQFRWEGSLLFRTLDPKDAAQLKRWETNRERVHSGSIRHFLSAVATGETNKQGFFVSTTERTGFIIKHRVAPDAEEFLSVEVENSTIPTWRLRFSKVLAVSFQKEGESRAYRNYQDEEGLRRRDESEKSLGRLLQRATQNSWLRLNGEYVVIDRFGNEYGTYALERSGYWEWERLCELLPSEYEPG